MRDPLYIDTDEARQSRMAADPQIRAAVNRLQRLKLLTGVLALVLIAAIWLVWR
jgi:hypothetical protein